MLFQQLKKLYGATLCLFGGWTQREDTGEFDLIKSECLSNACFVLETVLGLLDPRCKGHSPLLQETC